MAKKKRAPIQIETKVNQLAEELAIPQKHRYLLQQALTHPTYNEGVRGALNNQRLEFLGDAVLDFLVGEYLYQRYPDADEGDLSKMRAVIVCEQSLSRTAVDMDMGEYLRLGHGSESSGDRERPSVLADAFEAVIGAVYLGAGIGAARRLILAAFAPEMDRLTRNDYEDKKSLLQEIVQRETGHSVSYRLMETKGPDHAPYFVSGAYCGDRLLGRGEGSNKKNSEQEAAMSALGQQREWLPALKAALAAKDKA